MTEKHKSFGMKKVTLSILVLLIASSVFAQQNENTAEKLIGTWVIDYTTDVIKTKTGKKKQVTQLSGDTLEFHADGTYRQHFYNDNEQILMRYSGKWRIEKEGKALILSDTKRDWEDEADINTEEHLFSIDTIKKNRFGLFYPTQFSDEHGNYELLYLPYYYRRIRSKLYP